MDVDNILNRYNLTRETARQYIDAIIQLNQSQAADEAQVSRQTINTYKNAFQQMTETDRAALISSLAHETLLERIETGERPE
jgi:hypothetical protein